MLRHIAETLTSVEAQTHTLLYDAPNVIISSQQGIHQVNAKLGQLEPQLHRAHQALRLLGLGYRTWCQRSQWLGPLKRQR